MYAVVKTGGKQYQVTSGDQVRVEKLPGDVGEKLELEEVLMVVDDANVTVGQPLVEGAKVVATIAEQGKHRKINVFKKRVIFGKFYMQFRIFKRVKLSKKN